MLCTPDGQNTQKVRKGIFFFFDRTTQNNFKFLRKDLCQANKQILQLLWLWGGRNRRFVEETALSSSKCVTALYFAHPRYHYNSSILYICLLEKKKEVPMELCKLFFCCVIKKDVLSNLLCVFIFFQSVSSHDQLCFRFLNIFL